MLHTVQSSTPSLLSAVAPYPRVNLQRFGYRLQQHITMICVNRRGIQGISDLNGRAFIALAMAEVPVLLISQSSAEGNFCFATESRYANTATCALADAFKEEISRGQIASVTADYKHALLTVKTSQPHEVCALLAKYQINIPAMVFGTKAITVAVKEADALRLIQMQPDWFEIAA